MRPDAYPDGNRLNSGNAGPDGWLYFGSMDDAEEVPSGSYHRWDGTQLETFGGRAAMTNGPVVSPDGRCLYTIDTANGVVRVHDRSSRSGEAASMPFASRRVQPRRSPPKDRTFDASASRRIQARSR